MLFEVTYRLHNSIKESGGMCQEEEEEELLYTLVGSNLYRLKFKKCMTYFRLSQNEFCATLLSSCFTSSLLRTSRRTSRAITI